MEKCYEYYSCKETDCIMFKKDENTINCWDFDETLCNHANLDVFKKLHLSKCELCLYNKSINSN